MNLNGKQVSALYALAGTVKRYGDLELDVPQEQTGTLWVQHTGDGRVWMIDRAGKSILVTRSQAATKR